MMCCVTKATPIHFIDGKCHEDGKIHKTCLTNQTGFVSHHIMPKIFNALRGGDTAHTRTHTHAPILTHKQKQFQEIRHAPGLKIRCYCLKIASVYSSSTIKVDCVYSKTDDFMFNKKRGVICKNKF